MTTTAFWVFNSITRANSNSILMFLQPVEPQEDFTYSAWNVVNPSPHSFQSKTLETTYSASIAEVGGSDFSTPTELMLGMPRIITNPDGQSPAITSAVATPAQLECSADQVGLFSLANTPPTPLSITWYVTGKKVVETNTLPTTALQPGNGGLFELQQTLYLMFAQHPISTATYTEQTVSSQMKIPFASDATDVYIQAYTDESDSIDKCRKVTKAEWDKLTG
ncbi:hypothetical protein [Actinoplanes sp. NPDC051851]|uniref:hypothetical protein n=1 Tax=Actinoplanes sp. NPDC051851 TaxID=3154753 RepID=UPI0034381A01